MLKRTWLVVLAFAALSVAGVSTTEAQDIVLYASDVSNVRGNWSSQSSTTAAGGQTMISADYGWSSADAPLAAPADYFEATFTAPASTTYHVWLRMRATGDSKWNDSVWVQLSDASDTNGSAAYRIGTSSALLVNLEPCTGCGVAGWGWQDRASWTGQSPLITFSAKGTHTIRVQTREDGAQIDQIVLSPVTYLSRAPGQVTNDATILPHSVDGGTTTTASASGGSSTPFLGSAISIPGTINAQDFDNGGEGVAYHDTTSGNSGGAYRGSDVDLEASADGGNNVGWIAAGEWLNYTVNVTTAGSYTLQLRTASPSGGSLHVGFNKSNVWSAVSVPATGGWQTWTTVNVPVTLTAGTQLLTLAFDSAGFNVNRVVVASAGGSTASIASAPSPGSLTPFGGTAWPVPGTVQAEDFDDGGEGVGYHDTTSGNSGGAYRNTNVDIEASAAGGYNVGWTAASEYLNYTVTVPTAGSYTVQLRVAAPSGGALHVGFNGASNVWSAVSVPATAGWQSWTTVSLPVTLGAGRQQLTVMFDTAGVNLDLMTVSQGSTASSAPPVQSAPASSPSGSTISVATFNVEIDGTETHARLVIDNLLAIGPRPQIITIQEANLAMYSVYLDELKRQTGQVWNGAMASHCNAGDWTGSNCKQGWYQGVAIFTTYNIVNTSSMLFPYWDCWTSARAGLRAAVDVNGTTLQVFTTHLQTGGCTNDIQSRYNSIAKLKSWASGYSAPQIVAGDFNADPDQIDTTQGMLPNFVDTWFQVGTGSRYTAFAPNPSMKIDYWFTDSSGRAQAISSQVFQNNSVSDHFPVQTTFTIR
jgi:endonuclease/exonuclease/phosphatase family metal-dependent hydrolase